MANNIKIFCTGFPKFVHIMNPQSVHREVRLGWKFGIWEHNKLM